MILKIIWLAGLQSAFLNYWRTLEKQQVESEVFKLFSTFQKALKIVQLPMRNLR